MREVLDPGDADASPPVAPTLEDDERLRRRIQLAPEALSTAGPIGSYLWHVLNADPQVKDADIASPIPGDVLITALSREGDGTPSPELLETIRAAVNREEVRPLCDAVSVQAAVGVPYRIEATLCFYAGPDPYPIMAEAQREADDYAGRMHKLGYDITVSGLHAALHRPGVQRVALTIREDIRVAPHQAPYCTGIELIYGGRDA